jgi:hypothetical protein
MPRHFSRARAVLIAGSIFLSACLGGVAEAGAADRPNAMTRCALALVLAVDISPSVNDQEYHLQMAGFASAFRHPAIVKAVSFWGSGGIAVTVVLWSSVNNQARVIDWTRVHDAASARALANRIEQMPRPLTELGLGTAVGAAMVYAAKQFARSPFRCQRRVIDVSGDGRSNVGPKPSEARDVIVKLGITINGLAIVSDEPDLNVYYRDQVIGGRSAFVITAATHEAFDVAIRQKLLREILPRISLN